MERGGGLDGDGKKLLSSQLTSAATAPPAGINTNTTTTAGEMDDKNPTITSTSNNKKTSKTVEPPTPQILQHIHQMSDKLQRKSISPGLRVKVRFIKKVTTTTANNNSTANSNSNNKLIRKIKWYGGTIQSVTSKGKKIHILYDDGTSEHADFPDKDIIVDDVNNGVHCCYNDDDDDGGNDGGGDDGRRKGGGIDGKEGEGLVGRGSGEKGGGEVEGDIANDDDVMDGSNSNKKKKKRGGGRRDGSAFVPAPVVVAVDKEKQLKLGKEEGEEEEGKTAATMDVDEKDEDVAVKDFIDSSSSFPSKGPLPEKDEIVDSSAAAAAAAMATAPVEKEVPLENVARGGEPQVRQQGLRVGDTDNNNVKENNSSEEEGEVLETDTHPSPPVAPVGGGAPPSKTAPDESISLPEKKDDSFVAAPISPKKKKKKINLKKKDEENASSSSGSTCSSASFAGPPPPSAGDDDGGGGIGTSKVHVPEEPAEMSSHVNVKSDNEDAENQGKETENVMDKINSGENDKEGEEDGQDEGETNEGGVSTSNTPLKEDPPVAKKKRNPLRIRIGLSAAAKRKIEEETDAMNNELASSKKMKLSNDDDDDAKMEDVSTAAAVKKNVNDALQSIELVDKVDEPEDPAVAGETKPPSKKRKTVDSEDAPSEGELQEDNVSKEVAPGVATTVDQAAPTQRKKPGRKKKMTEIEKLKQSSIELDKNISSLSNDVVDMDSGKSPRSLTSPTTEDDGNAFSIARVGRKAAQRAAEKIAEKKTKSRTKDKDKDNLATATTPKNQKKEEDPWVQCDRCHKWRHLSATVNLDSLPEHWFCELNTNDPKRNNCDAPEQTPKEVAKEKKRAKKLAWKKLQMEQAQASAKEAEQKKRARSTSPRGSDKEAEFDTNSITDSNKKADEENVDQTAIATRSPRSPSPKPLPPKPKRRGRPPRSDKEKEKTSASVPGAFIAGKDGPKQEWVQCEKCEKWRRLPPRISAEDLPDVWYCSMNTWDINLATCTAIEDKHEENTKDFNVQSQIPTFAGSSSKTSYRNLIFGNGRQKRNISERLRAQESLFARDEEVDMSAPPTAVYANSSAFFNKSLAKASPYDSEKVTQPSIFDYMACSRVWAELNHVRRPNSKQHLYGYEKFCRPDGTLNKDSVDTLKAMTYFAVGEHALSGNEVLLEVQLQHWGYDVPSHWLELRSLSTLEIVNYILEELIRDGLVECIIPDKPSLDNTLYRRRQLVVSTSDDIPVQQGNESAKEDSSSSCLKISKPWK